MRRGRIFAAAAVVVVMLATAVAGTAATPQQLFKHSAVTQGYGGVGSQTPPPKLHQVAGATHTQQRAAGVAPASHVAGTLPFTGLQLGVFAVIGFALLGGGLLIRRAGRSRHGEL